MNNPHSDESRAPTGVDAAATRPPLSERDLTALREAHLQGLFDAASEGVITVDESQTIVMANRAAAAMFRCRVDELIGTSLDQWIPERFRAHHRLDVAAFGRSEAAPRHMGLRERLIALRRDGSEFPMRAGIFQTHVDGVRLYSAILTDFGEHDQLSAALRGSERMLDATYSGSSVPMVHIDPVTRRFTAANSAFCALTGFSEPELVRMDVDDLNHPDCRLDIAKFGALIDGSAGYREDKRLVRKDGTVIWVSVTGSVVPAEGSQPLQVVGVVQDITWRHEAEIAVRSREMRLSFLMRLSTHLRDLDDPDRICAEAARMLGEFVGASRVGYAEDTGDGVTIGIVSCYAHLVPPLDGRFLYQDYGPALLEAFRHGRTVVRPDIAGDATLTPAEKAAHEALNLGATVNVPLLRGNTLQAVFFVHASRPRAWTPPEVALFQDVAERVRADLERARAETRTRMERATLLAALESMNDAVCIVDAQGDPVTYNKAFLAFFRLGEPPRLPLTLQGLRDLLDMMAPDGTIVPEDQRPVPRALRGESCNGEEYHLHQHPSGERWIGSMSFAPIRGADEGIVGAVITARDITEDRRTRQELEVSHASLQRLIAARDGVQEAERTRIARELHDEVQQSLAAIAMESAVVRTTTGDADKEVRAAMERIDRLATSVILSMRRIIHGLHPQALEELGLVAALQSLADGFAERFGIGCTVDASALREDAGSPLVPASTCLYRVTQEALNNVAWHAGATQVAIRLASRADGGLSLTVEDNGTGFRTDEPVPLTSLGLLGMRERLRVLGGRLQVRSSADRGTTLEATLPPLAAPPSPP